MSGSDTDLLLANPQLAQALRAQAYGQQLLQQGEDTSPIMSPWQGVNRLAQALIGGLQVGQAQQQIAKAGQDQNQSLNNFLSSGQAMLTGGSSQDAQTGNGAYPPQASTGGEPVPQAPASGSPSAAAYAAALNGTAGNAVPPPQLKPIIDAAADKYGVPRGALYGVLSQESNFGAAEPNNIGNILPSTAAQPGYGISPLAPGDISKPAANIDFAAHYLAAKAQANGGGFGNPQQLGQALLGYNGGGDPNYVQNVESRMGLGGPPAGSPMPQLASSGAVATDAGSAPGSAPVGASPQGMPSPMGTPPSASPATAGAAGGDATPGAVGPSYGQLLAIGLRDQASPDPAVRAQGQQALALAQQLRQNGISAYAPGSSGGAQGAPAGISSPTGAGPAASPGAGGNPATGMASPNVQRGLAMMQLAERGLTSPDPRLQRAAQGMMQQAQALMQMDSYASGSQGGRLGQFNTRTGQFTPYAPGRITILPNGDLFDSATQSVVGHTAAGVGVTPDGQPYDRTTGKPEGAPLPHLTPNPATGQAGYATPPTTPGGAPGFSALPTNSAPGNAAGPDINLAKASGVPVAPADPYAGLNPVDRAKAAADNRMKIDTDLAKEDSDQIATDRNTIATLQHFKDLNAQSSTGPDTQIPGIYQVKMRTDTPFATMDSIAKQISPGLRAGTGIRNATQYDEKLFKAASVGTENTPQVNTNIANGAIARLQNDQSYRLFRQQYVQVNGHLEGMDGAWQAYVDHNPIFDPAAPKGSFALNQNRAPWADWMKVNMDPQTGQLRPAAQQTFGLPAVQGAASSPQSTLSAPQGQSMGQQAQGQQQAPVTPGRTARLPNGQRVIWDGGQWRPFGANPPPQSQTGP